MKVKSSQKKKRKVKVKTVIWAQTSFVSTIKIIIPPTIFFFLIEKGKFIEENEQVTVAE